MKIALLTLLCVIASNEPDFVSQQKKYPRVRNAYHEKEALLTRRLKEHNLSLDNLNILIMAYKTECVMDIYAKKREDKVYKKVTTYKMCPFRIPRPKTSSRRLTNPGRLLPYQPL